MKNTSSFVSEKEPTAMFDMVKIVEEICKILSVSENCRALLPVFSLKNNVTVLLFKS